MKLVKKIIILFEDGAGAIVHHEFLQVRQHLQHLVGVKGRQHASQRGQLVDVDHQLVDVGHNRYEPVRVEIIGSGLLG